jgi:hypothetical protein
MIFRMKRAVARIFSGDPLKSEPAHEIAERANSLRCAPVLIRDIREQLAEIF